MRRVAVEPIGLSARSRVLVYEFELKDRGKLGKLATRWTDPHVLGDRKFASSWVVKFQRGKLQQVHQNHVQKYD